MIAERMKQSKPPSPIAKHKIPRTKSSHNFSQFPKQFEASLSADAISVKKQTVEEYLCADKAAIGRRSKSKSPDVKQQQRTDSSSSPSKASTTSAQHVVAVTKTKRGKSSSSQVAKLNENLDSVDKAFEDLFEEASSGSRKK